MRLDVYLHFAPDPQLTRVLELLEDLTQGAKAMSAELDALKAEVESNTAVEGSAVALIQGLANQIAALKDDPAALADLTAKLKGSADALAAAITANTPAAPPPTP